MKKEIPLLSILILTSSLGLADVSKTKPTRFIIPEGVLINPIKSMERGYCTDNDFKIANFKSARKLSQDIINEINTRLSGSTYFIVQGKLSPRNRAGCISSGVVNVPLAILTLGDATIDFDACGYYALDFSDNRTGEIFKTDSPNEKEEFTGTSYKNTVVKITWSNNQEDLVVMDQDVRTFTIAWQEGALTFPLPKGKNIQRIEVMQHGKEDEPKVYAGDDVAKIQDKLSTRGCVTFLHKTDGIFTDADQHIKTFPGIKYMDIFWGPGDDDRFPRIDIDANNVTQIYTTWFKHRFKLPHSNNISSILSIDAKGNTLNTWPTNRIAKIRKQLDKKGRVTFTHYKNDKITNNAGDAPFKNSGAEVLQFTFSNGTIARWALNLHNTLEVHTDWAS